MMDTEQEILEESSPVSLPEEEVGEEDDILEHVHSHAREQRRVATRPFLDHLKDAVRVLDDGAVTFTQKNGMQVIIERCASCLSNKPWLDTRVYIVKAVDYESGALRLWDDELKQHASSNFKTGLKLGYRFKVPELGKKNALPVRNKAAPKVAAEAKPTKTEDTGDKLRRIYATKGVIHTRIKGIAYVPQGQTKAEDSMRLVVTAVGTSIKVKHPDLGWEETWAPTKDV
jgi:hypothetical protein